MRCRSGRLDGQGSRPLSETKPRLRRSVTLLSHAPVAIVAASPELSDIDLRAIRTLSPAVWVIVPRLRVGRLQPSTITPRYKSEARILIDGRENVFLRPNGERSEERSSLDAEAVTSQVQLLLSRDLAREVIKANKLAELPEFDPVLRGISPLRTLLALFGIGRDPFKMTPEERVLEAYYERLTAYAVDKSRVMVIEFQSRDRTRRRSFDHKWLSRHSLPGKIRPGDLAIMLVGSTLQEGRGCRHASEFVPVCLSAP